MELLEIMEFLTEGITSFTTIPLRVATYMGILTALFSVGFGSYIVGKALIFGDPVPGFPSLIAVITFLGGVQLLTLGIIGEYLKRINEVKNRPLYFVQENLHIEAKPEQSNEAFQSTKGIHSRLGQFFRFAFVVYWDFRSLYDLDPLWS